MYGFLLRLGYLFLLLYRIYGLGDNYVRSVVSLVDGHLERILTEDKPQKTYDTAAYRNVEIHINVKDEVCEQRTYRNDYEYVRHTVNEVGSSSYKSYEKRNYHHYYRYCRKRESNEYFEIACYVLEVFKHGGLSNDVDYQYTQKREHNDKCGVLGKYYLKVHRKLVVSVVNRIVGFFLYSDFEYCYTYRHKHEHSTGKRKRHYCKVVDGREVLENNALQQHTQRNQKTYQQECVERTNLLFAHSDKRPYYQSRAYNCYHCNHKALMLLEERYSRTVGYICRKEYYVEQAGNRQESDRIVKLHQRTEIKRDFVAFFLLSCILFLFSYFVTVISLVAEFAAGTVRHICLFFLFGLVEKAYYGLLFLAFLSFSGCLGLSKGIYA